jgi:beta propeller repeat protein
MMSGRKSILFFLSFAYVIVIPGVRAVALPTQDIPIALGNGDQTLPTIAGNWIAWEDRQAGRIRVQNRTTNTQFLVGPNPGGGSQGHPRISGDTVVWQGNPDAKGTLFYDNLADAATPQKVFDEVTPQYVGDVSGNLAIWQESIDSPLISGDLYGSYIGSNTKFPISTTGGVNPWPVTDGRFVVWREWNGANHTSLYMKDLQTGSSSLLQFSGGDPEIEAGIAVFGADGGIAVRNLLTGDSSTIPTQIPFSVSISGDLLVYSIKPPGKNDYDLWGVHRQTGEQFLISDAPGDQLFPDVNGNFVVWADTRNGNFDIYGTFVPEPATMTLVGCGLLCAFFIRRRPNKQLPI